MDFTEIKNYLETNKDNTEVQEYLKGLSKPTLDSIKTLVTSDKDFKSWLDSEKDNHYNKAFGKFKEKDLQKLIDDEVAKRNPSETPEQKKIRELEERLNAKEKEATRKQLVNNALTLAQEKKLPASLVEFFIGENEEETNSNIQKFETVFTEAVEKILAEKGTGTYIPPKTNNNNNETKDSILNTIRDIKHRK